MEHFSVALSVVIVCQRSLAVNESAAAPGEETLRHATRLLKNVYNEIDAADLQLSR